MKNYGGILSKEAMYLYNNGKNYYSYRMLGAHKVSDDNGNDGYPGNRRDF